MQAPQSHEPVTVTEMLMSNPRRGPITDPDFGQPIKPIGEFAMLPDFPGCTLGQHVNVGGSVGVVVEITSQSIKLRTVERTNQSFNINRLLTLYGPRPEMVVIHRPTEEPRKVIQAPVVALAPTPPVVIRRDVLDDPDFSAPVKPIAEWISQPNFPKCVYGAHVEIGGYTGVVVEIVKQQSVRVRASEGTSRTFNADTLRKIYGQA
jgi:hypothetical protein